MAMQAPISFTVMEIIPDAKDKYFRRKPLRAAPEETIAHLRKLSAESFNRAATDIQLIHFGKILEDALTFEAAGIREGSTVLVYPKFQPERKPPPSKQVVRKKILKAITRLYKMKYLNILGRSEFLEKLYYDMPELDTSTLAILQTSRLLVKYMLPKFSKELDEIAETYPLLGKVLVKAIDWAPSLLKVVPPVAPNMFSMESPSDESDDETVREASGSQDNQTPRALRRRDSDYPLTANAARPLELRGNPQPGPSREPQPGPSQPPQRAVTGPMLQAALQAAYSSQTQVVSQTFAWQLKVMKEMGFSDEKACIEALVKSGGDVDMAVNLLFRD